MNTFQKKYTIILTSVLSLTIFNLGFAHASPVLIEFNSKNKITLNSDNSKSNGKSNEKENPGKGNDKSKTENGNSNKTSSDTSVTSNDSNVALGLGTKKVLNNSQELKNNSATIPQSKVKNVVNEKKFKTSSLIKGQANKKTINKRAEKVKFPKSDPKCGESIKKGNSAKTSENSEKVQCADYIVVFKPGTASGKVDEIAGNANAQVKRKFTKVINAALIYANPNKIAALAKNPNVSFVEQDATVTTTAVQSNPSWGLDRVDQRNLPLSKSYDDLNNSGSNIPVYVVDTGINAAHSDFESRVTAGFSVISDGLGSNDCNGHGTHVAGTIGGRTYGVAKTVTLIPVRVLNCSGSGTYSGVIAGLDWIAANHPAGVPAVVNMSLGGPASSSVDIAVSNLVNKKITVVVAAGNSNADACNFTPARVAGAITVGATESNDSRASYSNFGSCLDVFAPGSAISSAWIGSSNAVNTISGTSMASPHVAGISARLLASNTGLSPSQVENLIKTQATGSVVSNPGPGSLNLLAFSLISSDGSTTNPETSPSPTPKPSPTKKSNNGKGKKLGLVR
jgi:serine protease